MSYQVDDLNPVKPILNIQDRAFSISLITLRIESIIRNNFCEVPDLQNKIIENPMLIFDILFLLIEKGEFKNISELKDSVFSSGKTSEVSGEIFRVIQESIIRSMPRIKNRAKYEDMLKISQSQDGKEPCYGVYYDRLAARYGYKLEDFYNLTLGQLHILLTVAADQQYEETEIAAALQGRKLKSRMKFEDVEEKVDSRLDDSAKELLERMQKEYQGKK